MNRIERLFNILLILQRRDVVRAVDLAVQFGVSTRTIYRDMDALGAIGVPIAALPSEGFRLVEGFYVPPVQFSELEAKALALGAQMLAAQASGETARAAHLAFAKVSHILPQSTRDTVDQLGRIIQFYQPNSRLDLDDPHLVQLQKAITEQRCIHIAYHSHAHDESTERTVEPYTLTYNEGVWYLNGYCHLRRDLRSFRLNRIHSLLLLDKMFVHPTMMIPHMQFQDVVVRFIAQAVRWVRERQHWGYVEDVQLEHDGAVVMRYRVQRLSEIKAWLLGWGAQAVVLSPDALRDEIRAEAQTLIQLLT